MQEVARKYRVGVTIRNLLPRCNHDPERAEYNMKRAWQLFHQTASVGYLQPPPAAAANTNTQAGTLNTMPKSPAASVSPPFTAPAHRPEPSVSADAVRSLETKVDRILANQAEILRVVGDLQRIVGASTSSQLTFQQETSTVLNHMSSTILQMESQLEDVAESTEALRGMTLKSTTTTQ